MRILKACILICWSVLTGAGPAHAETRPDTIFAAASLSVVLDELVPAYKAATGRDLRTSYAASGSLARQIEAGADADVFVSADLEWMDYLAQRGLITAESRSNLLGNRLVLVAPAGAALKIAIARGFPLVEALHGGRLAMGDPDSVPAGRYAKAALEYLDVWAKVADHIVRAENVRTALLYVDRGEAPLGIVYRTDARDDSKVQVVGEFPSDAHPAIVYPIALAHNHQPGSEALLRFLKSAPAQAAFERHGFTVFH